MYVFSQWKINVINFVNHHEFHVSCTRSFSSCQGYLKYQVQNCCQWLILFCYCSNSRWSILLKVYIPGIYLKCSALRQFTSKSPRVGWILCLLLVFQILYSRQCFNKCICVITTANWNYMSDTAGMISKPFTCTCTWKSQDNLHVRCLHGVSTQHYSAAFEPIFENYMQRVKHVTDL